jgi:preprotein translocase subunit SecD
MRLSTTLALILSTGCLIFAAQVSIFQVRMVQDAPSADSEQLAYRSVDGQNITLAVQKTVLLDQSAVQSAVVAKDSSTGRPIVRVLLTPQGRARFAEITGQSIHKRVAVVVDGKLVEAPIVQAQLTTTFIPVLGEFTEQQASHLAARINAALGKR